LGFFFYHEEHGQNRQRPLCNGAYFVHPYIGVGAAMRIRAMLSSNHSEWETPADLFRELDNEFNFTLDPCATNDNAKCNKFFSKDQDGLSLSWAGEVVFMNPPYGREIGKWVGKAHEESRGAVVVGLIPSRTDTAYWHDHVQGFAKEVRFIRGRVKFKGVNPKGKAVSAPAPFPSCVVVWRP